MKRRASSHVSAFAKSGRRFLVGIQEIDAVYPLGVKALQSWRVTSRYGQGRALLTQRFRPAFYSRVTVCSQQECV